MDEQRTRAQWLSECQWALQPIREVILAARSGVNMQFNQAAVGLGLQYAMACATAAAAAPMQLLVQPVPLPDRWSPPVDPAQASEMLKRSISEGDGG